MIFLYLFIEFLRETSKTLAEEYNNKMEVHPCVAEYADGIRQLRYLDFHNYNVLK